MTDADDPLTDRDHAFLDAARALRSRCADLDIDPHDALELYALHDDDDDPIDPIIRLILDPIIHSDSDHDDLDEFLDLSE